jgi:hypothetical protein
MLRAATSFDLRQHLIDNGIVSENLPEGCIQALQQIGNGFIRGIRGPPELSFPPQPMSRGGSAVFHRS